MRRCYWRALPLSATAPTEKHTLTIYTSNQKYFHNDVTRQLHEAADPTHIHIVIDGLKIPSGDGGMSPDISGWDNIVETDIDMN